MIVFFHVFVQTCLKEFLHRYRQFFFPGVFFGISSKIPRNSSRYSFWISSRVSPEIHSDIFPKEIVSQRFVDSFRNSSGVFLEKFGNCFTNFFRNYFFGFLQMFLQSISLNHSGEIPTESLE